MIGLVRLSVWAKISAFEVSHTRQWEREEGWNEALSRSNFPKPFYISNRFCILPHQMLLSPLFCMMVVRTGFVRPLVLLLVVLGVATGCLPVRKLGKDELLLYRQQIRGNKQVPVEELEPFLKQRPNSRIFYFPIMPYLNAYYIGKRKYERKLPLYRERLKKAEERAEAAIAAEREKMQELLESDLRTENPERFERDSTRLANRIRTVRQEQTDKVDNARSVVEKGNWLMQSVGEPPSLYDAAAAQEAATQMSRFLRARGFFHSSVILQADTTRKLVALTYQIAEGLAAQISQVERIVPDSAMNQLLSSSYSFLIDSGKVYTEALLDQERNQLSAFLRNQGYFDFSKNYIFFEVDTALRPLEVAVKTYIGLPEEGLHQRYYLQQVTLETSVDALMTQEKDTLYFDGVRIIRGNRNYSKRVLGSKMALRPQKPYSLSDAEQTQRALAGMDIFKFININYLKTDEDSLDVRVFASDYEKYQFAVESGLNISQSLPGPFLSLSLKNRNLFGSCDVMELRARAAIEAQAAASDLRNTYASQEYGLNGTWRFPRLMFPLPRATKERLQLQNARTVIQGGYALVDRPEYRRSNFQSALGYQWQNRRNDLFNFTLADVSVIQSTLQDSAFRARLVELLALGNTLLFSFDNAVITNFNFSFTRASNAYGTGMGRARFFRLYGEVGGPYADLFNTLFGQSRTTLFGLRVFRYFRVFGDFREAIGIGRNSQLASRLHVGLARHYGSGDPVLPYEKYFFSGGSNSNRAWRPRRIGPGSAPPPLLPDGRFDYRFEQPGEVIIEGNLEYRTHLFSVFDWAFFVDASNVWLLDRDFGDSSARFNPTRFWKEFAVGAGFGLRLNFSFFLMRFDVGIKMLDPARPAGQRFIGDQLSLTRPFGAPGQAEINIGIGYPF